MSNNVTFAKLKTGNWGVRGNGTPPAPGAIVTVRKADGSTSTVTVESIVGKFSDGNWIAAIIATPRAANTSRTSGRSASRYAKAPGKCRGRGCGAMAVAGKDGMCAECYFDEYDK